MVREMTVSELAKALENGRSYYLLDVRRPEERAFASLPGSQWIPLQELVARAGEVTPPEKVPIVVYCHHGVRSRVAADALMQMGHEEVYSLAGGIDAWSVQVDPGVPRY